MDAEQYIVTRSDRSREYRWEMQVTVQTNEPGPVTHGRAKSARATSSREGRAPWAGAWLEFYQHSWVQTRWSKRPWQVTFFHPWAKVKTGLSFLSGLWFLGVSGIIGFLSPLVSLSLACPPQILCSWLVKSTWPPLPKLPQLSSSCSSLRIVTKEECKELIPVSWSFHLLSWKLGL